eukprot:SAG31_NODE_5181_length_2695_cov_1.832435_2_plen_51_part_00
MRRGMFPKMVRATSIINRPAGQLAAAVRVLNLDILNLVCTKFILVVNILK